MKQTLSSLLSPGAQNAIPAADLTKLAGIESRDIRRAVELERVAGNVILADERGYYLPSEDRETAVYEVTAWLARRMATAKAYALTIRAARAYLAKLRADE